MAKVKEHMEVKKKKKKEKAVLPRGLELYVTHLEIHLIKNTGNKRLHLPVATCTTPGDEEYSGKFCLHLF